ncbi:DMT family transporter [Pusillimonas sp. CC-YST705]|uniref:DMT family transporter n=1 Tax=Mesopusillimonas faecipullorum TaxID=2755040 RepID=A0ABS8CEC9_9BURK|nr:DMT family transporter [Mesopusillimonas faecipullorum]MCB5364392.1 DMT family transporter [Mesopusillimonas faecipullorum]
MGKYAWGMAAMLFWGAAPVVLKSLVAWLPGSLLMTVVYALAACVTLPWLVGAVRRGGVAWRTWLEVAGVGLMLTSCFNLLAAMAAHAVSGTTLGAVVAMEPLMVAILSALLARRWLPWHTSVALAVSLLGAWLLVMAPSAMPDAGNEAWAVGLVVLGALAWSAAVVWSARIRTAWPPLQTSMIMICCGSLPFLAAFPFMLAQVESWPVLPAAAYGGIAFMALGATVAANLLWLRSLRELGPLANSLLINVGPLFTFVLSATWLGEPWGGRQTLGALCIVLGLSFGAWYQDGRLRGGRRQQAC